MPNSYYNHGATPATGSSGSSSLIRTEFDSVTTGFATVETAMNLKAPLASPALTGDPTAPTPAAGDNDTSIATTAFAMNMTSPAFLGTPTSPTAAGGTNTTQIATTAFVVASFAPLASPALTGNPTAPTPSAGDNDTSIATTAFVATSFAPLASPALTGVPTVPTPTINASPTTKQYVDAAIGSASPVAAWVSGATYTTGQAVYSLVDFQTYRHITATSSLATDPAVDHTNWTRLSGGVDNAKVYFFGGM